MTLRAAETWGVPPWEIHRAPGSALWLARLQLYEQLHAKAVKHQRAITDEDD